MNKRLTYILFAFLIFLIVGAASFTSTCTGKAFGLSPEPVDLVHGTHRGHKHCIGVASLGLGVRVSIEDWDGDGKADTCVKLILATGPDHPDEMVTHIISTWPANEDGTCYNKAEGYYRTGLLGIKVGSCWQEGLKVGVAWIDMDNKTYEILRELTLYHANVQIPRIRHGTLGITLYNPRDNRIIDYVTIIFDKDFEEVVLCDN